MSPSAKKKIPIPIWVAIIGALALIAAALIPGVSQRLFGGHGEKSVSGVISDSVTGKPLARVKVEIQTSTGRELAQSYTDNSGKYSTPISGDLTQVLLHATLDGYQPYDANLPAQEMREDVHLVRLEVSIQIPDGWPLDKALTVVANDIGITAAFSTRCGGKATAALVNHVELAGDRRKAEDFLSGLTKSVKNSGLHYGVTKIGDGHYEIDCL